MIQISRDDAVRRLMEMQDEMVYAKDIAPIMKMDPARIVLYAKNGKWDPDQWGNFIISGDDPKTSHVKFFRKDFLQKCGFMEPEKEEDPTREILTMLGKLIEGQSTIMRALSLMLDHQMKEKTAGAATPTD